MVLCTSERLLSSLAIKNYASTCAPTKSTKIKFLIRHNSLICLALWRLSSVEIKTRGWKTRRWRQKSTSKHLWRQMRQSFVPSLWLTQKFDNFDRRSKTNICNLEWKPMIFSCVLFLNSCSYKNKNCCVSQLHPQGLLWR